MQQASNIKPVKGQADSDYCYRLKWAMYLSVPSKFLFAVDSERLTSNDGIDPYITLEQDVAREFLDKALTSDDVMAYYERIVDMNPEVTLLDIILYTPSIVDHLDVANDVFETANEPVRIDSYDRFKDILSMWNNINASTIEAESNILANLIEYSQALDRVPEFTHDNFYSEYVTYLIKPRWLDTGYQISNEDKDVIFEKAALSPECPLVILKPEGETDETLSNDSTSYRVFRRPRGIANLNEQIPYKQLIPSDESIKKNNRIYLIVWCGQQLPAVLDQDVYVKYYLAVATINFNTGMIKVKVPSVDQEKRDNSVYRTETESNCLDVLAKALPFLDLSINREVNIIGKVNVYGDNYQNLEMDRIVMYHMITVDPMFQNYLLLQEKQTNQLFRKSTKVYYPTPYVSSKTIGKPIKQRFGSDKESHESYRLSSINFSTIQAKTDELSFFDRKEIRTVAGQRYLTLTIRSINRQYVQEIIRVLCKLLHVYSDYYPSFYEYYSLFTGGMTMITVEDSKTLKRDSVPQTNMQRLRYYAPGMFSTSYSQYGTQFKYQPYVLDPDFVRQNNIKDGDFVEVVVKAKDRKNRGQIPDRVEKRRVMQYPKPGYIPIVEGISNIKVNMNESIYVVSDSIEYPFVGLKVNNDSNPAVRERYPLIPACFNVDQLSKKGSPYYKYIHKEKIKKKEPNTMAAAHKGYAPEYPGGYAMIQGDIHSILKNSLGYDIDLYRRGVTRGPNSFIHCLLICTGSRGYSDMKPEAQLELARTTRQSIANRVLPEVCRQELYDYTNEEILALIRGTNESVYFDPRLYYRACEEYFNVNIFLLTIKKRDEAHKSTVDSSRVTYLGFRHIGYYSRQINPNRQTIIVLVHKGGPSDPLEYPQSEIVCYTTPNAKGMTNYGFPPYASSTIVDSFNQFFSSVVLYKDASGNHRYDLLPSHLNLFAIQAQVISQYIDCMGKTRAINLKLKDEMRVTMMIPASQPIAVPSESFNVLRLPLSLISKYVKCTLSGYSMVNGKVTGIYMNVSDMIDIYYIPVTQDVSDKEASEIVKGLHQLIDMVNLEKELEIRTMTKTIGGTPRNLRLPTDVSPFTLFIEMKKTSLSLQAFYEFLVRFARMEVHSRGLMPSIMITGKDRPYIFNMPDAIRWKTYDPWNIISPLIIQRATAVSISFPGRIPVLRDLSSFLSYMSTISSGLIEDGKILVSPDLLPKMKYCCSMIWKKIANKDLEINPTVPLEARQVFHDTSLFKGRYELDKWIDKSVYDIIVRKKLSNQDVSLIQPYIYLTDRNQVCLITNCKGQLQDTLKKCCFICHVWKTKGINLSFSVNDFSKEYSVMDTSSCSINVIDSFGHLAPLSTPPTQQTLPTKDNQPTTARIIQYVDERGAISGYGAILC